MKDGLSLHIHASNDSIAERLQFQQCIENFFATCETQCKTDQLDNSIPLASLQGTLQLHIFILGSQLSPTDEITWQLRLQQIASHSQNQDVFLLRKKCGLANDSNATQICLLYTSPSPRDRG